MDMIISICYTR